MTPQPIPHWLLTASDIAILIWLILMIISTTTLVALGIIWIARLLIRPVRPQPPPDRLVYPAPPREQVP